jgi:hypothetical protein
MKKEIKQKLFAWLQIQNVLTAENTEEILKKWDIINDETLVELQKLYDQDLEGYKRIEELKKNRITS